MDIQVEHEKVEWEFLQSLEDGEKAVLKGGTALRFCYGLDRFSEDLDFDALSPDFSTIRTVEKFCRNHNYSYFEKKNTETVQRCTIHYGGQKPLKIETSYRRILIPQEEITKVNGITVYTIDVLARMKLNAYLSRDRIRDLYDASFIINNFWDSLSETTRSTFQMALAEKGPEQFDLVIAEQKDELVNVDALMENFLNAYEKVGVKTEMPLNTNSMAELKPEKSDAVKK